ncbi:MAG: BamA/TamA family outer membrane protein [Bacteroidales bacterium]|jgi:outer membrane protein assembly factor BamA|nr:BamA/TamA family outer membrane protein [Bacteroidales bacterium]
MKMTICRFRLIVLALCVGILASCSPFKHISENGMLLSKNKVEVSSKDFSKGTLANLILQDPNTEVFGMKLGMYFYSLSPRGEDSTVSWFSRHTFRSWGEKPAELDENMIFQSQQNISQYLKTKGSFGSTITDTIIFKRKWYAPWLKYKRRVVVKYNVKANDRYRINNFTTEVKDSVIAKRIEEIMKDSPIKRGEFYDEDILSEERDRVVDRMHEYGYFSFAAQYVNYLVDTANGNNTLNLTMKIGNPVWRPNDSIVREGRHKVYTIRNIYVYPNYQSSSLTGYNQVFDTTIVFHKQTKHSALTRFFFLNNGEQPIKTKPLLRSMLFQKDSVYSPTVVKRTYSALSQLRNFKFIDIKPIEVRDVDWRKDTLPVDFELKISISDPISIATGAEATYSQTNASYSKNPSNFGLGYNLGFRHSNIFKGAEILSLNTKVSSEIRSDIFSRSRELNFWSYFSAFEVGVDLGIEFPRFLAPFATKFYSMQFRPHTTVKTGFNYQKRPESQRHIFNLTYGYTWITSEKTSHWFFPAEINFVDMDITSDDYQRVLASWSKRMRYQVSDHFVTDMRYSYLYNGQSIGSRQPYRYFSFNAETGGNLLYLISSVSKAVKDSLNQYYIFRIPFSQYARTDVDFRQYIYPTERQTLVFRFYGGIGVSYGNAKMLPYEKNFFGGGPNNLRAWELRSLGPGAAKADTLSSNVERSGDIAIGGNIEYRFPIFGFIEGGAFMDFGNVWLLRPQADLSGGAFSWDFYKEIAVGIGVGLRFNLTILTLRLDAGWKLYDPAQDLSARFVLPKSVLKSPAFQFGINYPF